ncbi:hypothetical protein D9M71_526200 [compost metagenome]
MLDEHLLIAILQQGGRLPVSGQAMPIGQAGLRHQEGPRAYRAHPASLQALGPQPLNNVDRHGRIVGRAAAGHHQGVDIVGGMVAYGVGENRDAAGRTDHPSRHGRHDYPVAPQLRRYLIGTGDIESVTDAGYVRQGDAIERHDDDQPRRVGWQHMTVFCQRNGLNRL